MWAVRLGASNLLQSRGRMRMLASNTYTAAGIQRFARASCFETLHALVETRTTALNYRLHGITTLGVDRAVTLSSMRHLSTLRHTYAWVSSQSPPMLRAPTRSCKQSTDVCVCVWSAAAQSDCRAWPSAGARRPITSDGLSTSETRRQRLPSCILARTCSPAAPRQLVTPAHLHLSLPSVGPASTHRRRVAPSP
jgi:hypothetical protein